MSIRDRRSGGRTEFTMEDEDKILRWLMYHHPEKTNWKSRSIYQELVRVIVLSPSNDVDPRLFDRMYEGLLTTSIRPCISVRPLQQETSRVGRPTYPAIVARTRSEALRCILCPERAIRWQKCRAGQATSDEGRESGECRDWRDWWGKGRGGEGGICTILDAGQGQGNG